MKVDNKGHKDDAGKLPWHLFAWDAAREIVKVLDFGQKKYAARNWERGMDWDRPFAALMRHMTAWWEGERNDPETGLPHLAHAGCCIMFLLAYEIRGIGQDTRPVTPGGNLSAADRALATLEHERIHTAYEKADKILEDLPFGSIASVDEFWFQKTVKGVALLPPGFTFDSLHQSHKEDHDPA